MFPVNLRTISINAKESEKLKELLMFHIASPKTCKCQFREKSILSTGIPGKNIRINVYRADEDLGPFGLLRTQRDVVTAQCARLKSEEIEVCGGMIQTIDRIIRPAADNILDILATVEDYRKFYELVQFADMEEEIREMTDNIDKLLTIFAPRNSAFKDITEEQMTTMFEDKDIARQTVQRHMMKNMLCCAGISRRNPFLDLTHKRTLSRHILSVRKRRNRYFIDDSEIIDCDKVAENGVVHTIDQILVPEVLEPQEPQMRDINLLLKIFSGFDKK